MASSAGVSTVLLGFFGSIGASVVAALGLGSGIFLQGAGPTDGLTLNPGQWQMQTIANAIADQTGSGGTAATTYASGRSSCNPGAATPCGGYSAAGSYRLTKNGAGTTYLTSDNTCTGTTTNTIDTNGFTVSFAGVVANGTGGARAP